MCFNAHSNIFNVILCQKDVPMYVAKHSHALDNKANSSLNWYKRMPSTVGILGESIEVVRTFCSHLSSTKSSLLLPTQCYGWTYSFCMGDFPPPLIIAQSHRPGHSHSSTTHTHTHTLFSTLTQTTDAKNRKLRLLGVSLERHVSSSAFIRV